MPTPTLFINPTSFAPAKFGNIAGLLNLILPFLLIILVVIFLFMLLLGAFTWITSSGTPENLKKAQHTFTYAILGLVIVLLSFVAVKIISGLFKLNLNFSPI